MRVLVLLVILVLATGAAYAQNDTAPDAGNDTATPGAGNDTPTNDTANDTVGNDTPTDGGAGAPPAADDCPKQITLLGLDDLQWHLTAEGPGNPRLNVCASAEVTFEVVIPDTEAVPHNFAVEGPGANAPPVSATFSPGESVTYTWTTPESGSFTYICKIHPQTMKGTVTVGAAATPAPGGEGGGDEITGEINGPTVQLKQIAGDAPCDRAIPAVVTRDIVGGPVIQDYVEGCTVSAEATEATAHPVDLVIPISLALIAVGGLAVFWVHKRYKP